MVTLNNGVAIPAVGYGVVPEPRIAHPRSLILRRQ
jgi:hypothetical protein